MAHVREHRSLLASAEKQLLIAIARRLPPWISSDHLTLLGLRVDACRRAGVRRSPTTPWSAALFALALLANWFGDSLDGTLARVRQQPRPRYGYYVDHVIDLAGTRRARRRHGGVGADAPVDRDRRCWRRTSSCPPRRILATHAVGVFRLSFAGMGPTELRILLAVGAVLRRRGIRGSRSPASACCCWTSAGSSRPPAWSCVFIVSAIRNARALYLAEPLPPRAGSSAAATEASAVSSVAGVGC